VHVLRDGRKERSILLGQDELTSKVSHSGTFSGAGPQVSLSSFQRFGASMMTAVERQWQWQGPALWVAATVELS
jgi:hypothetical protein